MVANREKPRVKERRIMLSIDYSGWFRTAQLDLILATLLCYSVWEISCALQLPPATRAFMAARVAA